MNEMRRVLALLLCFVMLVGMLPAGALATDVQTTEPSETVVETQVTEATSAAQETTLAAETESIPTESVEESVPATTVVTEPAETTDETTAPTEIVVEDTVVETLGEVDPEEILSSVEALDQALTAIEYSTPDGFVDAAIFFTDLHSNKSGGGDYKESTIKSVFGSIATNSKLPFSVVTSVGDAFSSNETAYTANTSTITKYIRTYLQDEDVAVKYTWSDHDRSTDVENFTGLLYGAGEDGTPGTADDGNYYIYAISMSDMTTDPRYSTKATFTSSLLTEFTDTVAKLDQTKPLFIASHMPLLVRRGDNGHALEWCNVINEAALKMDVAFFFGHNHRHDQVSDYHYGKGDTMPVQGNGTTKNVELNFHHFCAGYLEPMSTGSYSSSTSRMGTAMVITILKDSIRYTVYDKNGVYGGSIGGEIDLSVKREHAAPAEPTVNTVTFEDDYTIITATALGLTDIDVNYVEDAIPEFGDNYYVAFDASLTGHTSGNQITYTIQAEDGMGADLSLFYVGENGALEELEYTSSTTDDGFTVLTFTTDKVGTFAYGVMPLVIPEGAVVSSLSITAPEKRNYFLSVDTENDGRVYLDISGLVVKAVYVHEDENYEKTVDWNRFDETVDGYSLSFGDLTEPGKKTVTVSYEGVSETFDVWVCAEKLEIEDVVIDFDEPSVITANITAGEPSAIAQVAMQGLLTGNVVMYSIVPTYGEGITELVGKAYVTLPIPEDVTNPAVYYVSPKGAVEQMPTVNNGNGTLTFTTEHFSDFIVGEDGIQIELGSGNADVESSTTTTEKKVYVLTNTIAAGDKVLIVSSNATRGYILGNAVGSDITVTINAGNLTVGGNTGSYTYIENPGSGLIWTVGSGFTFTSGNYRLGMTRQNNIIYSTYELSLSTSSNWTYRNYTLRDNDYDRYAYYSRGNNDNRSNWTQGGSSQNTYLYKEVTATETVGIEGGTYKATGNNVDNAVAIAGQTVALASSLTYTTTSGTTSTPAGWRATYEVVTTKGNPAVISSINGSAATLSGVAGTAVVKVTYTSGNLTAWDEFYITAKAPYYDVEIETPASTTIKTGSEVTLVAEATMNGSAVTRGTIKWTSSNRAVADVDEANGKVTAVAPGNVTITATYYDASGTEKATDTIYLKVEDPTYSLAVTKPDVNQLKIGNTVDLVAKTYMDDVEMTGQTITWTSSDNTIATVDENGKITGVKGGSVKITASWTDPKGVEHTETIDLEIVDNVWTLDLCQPVGGTYESITKPIVIKDVVDNQTYTNIWAVITKDGVDVGALSEEQLKHLTFVSSNPDIATVDQATGLVTFHGKKGAVAITAVYEYAEGKSVTDTVIFSVSPDHYYVPEDGTDDFPEFPNEGAIRFDKTATAVGNFSQTGITKVELSMTGVPFEKNNPMDVVLMLDHSNSMTDTRMAATRTAVKAFIQNIVKNDDGTYNNNRIYVGSFAGGNPEYLDTATERARHYFRIYEMTNGEQDGYQIIGDDAELEALLDEIDRVFVKITSNTTAIHGTNTPYGTEYDQSLEECYNTLLASKEDGNKQFCVFMSDGIPNVYRYGADEDNKTASSEEMAAMFTPTSGTRYTSRDTDYKYEYWSTLMKQEGVTVFSVGLGLHGTNSSLNGATAAECESVANMLLNDISGPAYETNVDTGSTVSKLNQYFFSVADSNAASGMKDVFENISKQILDAAKDVKVVDTMGEKYTMVFELPNDNMADVMEGTGFGADNPFYIEVKDYPLYPVDANGNKVSATSENIADYKRDTDNAKSLIKLYLGRNGDTYFAAKDGSGTRFDAPVFNTNPVGTKRYWTKTAPADLTNAVSVTVQESGANVTYYFVKAGNGTHNIASGAYAFGNIVHQKTIVNMEEGPKEVTTNECNDLIIATPYFVYNAATKELVWTTEKLSTSELAISYFLYLEKSGGFVGSEEEIDPDTYTTNKAAYLYYTNFNGVECEQEFPVPQMTWNGAQVSYVFYLVNEAGQPVNRAGTVVPFSEAVYVTDVNTYAIIWNRLEQAAGLEAERLAHDLVPDVYELYDHGAKYNVHVYENENYVNLNNHFVIESGFGADGPFTTYVFNTKADDTKYREPGAYAVQSVYLCKSYLPEGSYTVSGNTVTSATYSKVDGELQMQAAVLSQQKDENGNTYLPGATIIDGFAYYIDAEGKVYTIVQKSDAKRVHGGFDFANTTVAFAVVWKPQLKEDTVVIDYGLDVSIDVIANDAMAAGVVGVRTDKPSVKINEGTYAAAKAKSADLMLNNVKVATATVDSLTNVRVSLDKTNGMLINEPMLFYYETDVNYYVNGVLQSPSMYSSVTVIPATTVYYEDSYVTLEVYKESDDSLVTDGARKWEVEGNTVNDTQATDRPGASKIGEAYDADNNYGYDGAYETMATHSMGSARKLTVDATYYGKAKFSFYGTGFDVISTTSNLTGTIVVQVMQGETVVKSKIVDTFYGYTMDANGDWIVSVNDPNAIYQVPVITVEGLEYGKYDVVITAAYNSFFAHNGTSSYDLYLDAIRIYDPTGNKNETANNAYVADGEGWPTYIELRDNIIPKQTFGSDYTIYEKVNISKFETGVTYYTFENGVYTVATAYTTGKDYFVKANKVNGIVFIDSNDSNMSIADYTSYGPNNELYLAQGQAIAFNIDTANAVDIQLGIKVANGTEVTYEINGDPVTLKSATDRYYSIKEYADRGTIAIKNTSGGILSLTNIKTTHASAPAEVTTDDLPLDTESVAWAMMFLRGMPNMNGELSDPNVDETEPTEPDITDPEETEPDTTEPDVTEPDVTEPEETEPDVTEPEETGPGQGNQNGKTEIKDIIKGIINLIGNLFNRWFS